MPLPGEFDLIARYFAPLARGHAGALGLTDDAAILRPGPGMDLVVTTDALVETVHFRAEDPPESAARKALRVNLSDVAAMGARPVGYTLAIALTQRADEGWLAAFTDALREDQTRFGVSLVGGDTVSTPGPMMISITAFGEVANGGALTRAGGRPGDRLFVSGTIGDAGAGLAILEGRLDATGDDADFLVARYQAPDPRTGLGPALIGIARAAIDVSDGLLADLGHICEASGCGAELALESIPRSAAARNCAALDPLEAMWAGDDYELLFAVPEGQAADAEAAARRCGLPVTAIGRLTEGRQVRVRDSQGREIDSDRRGFSHF